MLWVGQEIAIAACDLAEVIGSAIALNLLFGLPLVWGVCLTACDVFAVLYLQNKGFRLVETLVITLIGVIAVSLVSSCFCPSLISAPWHSASFLRPNYCTTAKCYTSQLASWERQ